MSFFLFLIKTTYSDTHIRLCGRVSDKNIFLRPISGNKATFFWLKVEFGRVILSKISTSRGELWNHLSTELPEFAQKAETEIIPSYFAIPSR